METPFNVVGMGNADAVVFATVPKLPPAVAQEPALTSGRKLAPFTTTTCAIAQWADRCAATIAATIPNLDFIVILYFS
jgi:hypothetical protein